MSFDAVVPDARRLAAPALAIGVIAAATVGGAWLFQWAGYSPCELCLKERIPHYAGILLGAVTVWLALTGRRSLLPACYVALTLIFAAGLILSIYHAGVEWHFWPGPESCTGTYAAPKGINDFLNQLSTTTVIRCDQAALRILGLSLAGWNAVVTAALIALSAVGLRAAISR